MVRKIKIIITMLLILGVCIPSTADQLISVDKALKKIFKKADRFDRSVLEFTEQQISRIESSADLTFDGTHHTSMIRYNVFKGDQHIGVAFEDTVFGKWGPIHYLVGLDLNGKIKKVVVLDYQEIRGKPIARNRYMKQYKGKTINDPIRLRRDIDGLSGATISSRSITNGIRKIVHILAILP